ncbi:MAG: C4-type zinc ribbon domain-containing protein [Nitrospirota bacterium]
MRVKSEEWEAELNEQLRLLINLQNVDKKIQRLVEEKRIIPLKIAEVEKKLKNAEQALEDKKAQYKKKQQEKKEKEILLDDELQRLKKLKSRTSEIKTNKEYQAHMVEIETTEKLIGEAEEKLLTVMEQLEEWTLEINSAEERIVDALKEFQCKKEQLEADDSQMGELLNELKMERQKVTEGIERELYETYNTLLRVRGGLAVVPVEDGSCMGCRLQIPPQVFNDVKKNQDIITCSYCHRFLYWGEGLRPVGT